MAALAFPDGILLTMATWTTDPYKFLLADSGAAVVVDGTVVYVDDMITGGHEFVDTGYLRQTVTTPTVTTVYSPTAIELHCDAPTFGTLSDNGIPAAWLALYAEVTNDLDSPLVAAWPVLYTPDGSMEALFTEPTHGFVAFPFACPSGF